MLPAQPNKSLIDGLTCLQALSGSRDPIGSRDLARQLELEPTRVNRLLKTLAHLGLVEQTERRKYRTGPAIHVLAAQVLFGSGLLRRAAATLQHLEKHGLIVALGVLWRDQTCYLYYSPPGRPVEQSLGHSQLFPAQSSGIGMAILAHRPESEVYALYPPDDDQHAADSEHVPAARLFEKLARIRHRGYALTPVPDSKNHTLAVPLGSPPYAAIGLSGEISDADVPTLLPTLRTAVQEIETSKENT